jgi:serine/threonine protein kinase
MATGVMIIGETGSGKSTAIEYLDPKETFFINVANKPLPFKSWKKKYTLWSKENQTGNTISNANADVILKCLEYINDKRPEIKNIIIDDFNYVSSFEFFDKINETGFQKFSVLGNNLARLARVSQKMREDIVIFYTNHPEDSVDIDGKRKVKALTIGKLVDEKLKLEGLFSIVLYAKVKKEKDGTLRYVFETQNNGENTGKSPRGMFESFEIPNNLQTVREAIFNYEN